MPKNVLIDLYNESFSIACGGLNVQFELCRILCELGINAKIKSIYSQENCICNNYYNDDFPIDDNCVVIYGECIPGNPSNAKNVVRWILAPIGVCAPTEILNTWGKNDLVYYFNSELNFLNNPEKIGNVYKLLNCIYINPNIKIYNFTERQGVCFSTRKQHIHMGNLEYFHPKNSFDVHRGYNIDDCINIFNSFKFFVCYDPLSFLIIISSLCGCIPIVYKIDGLNKEQWLQKTAVAEYLKDKGLDNLYGVAYGIEDAAYAIDTLHLVKDQWNDIVKYCKEKTIIPFINDIQNFENKENTIQNNYFST